MEQEDFFLDFFLDFFGFCEFCEFLSFFHSIVPTFDLVCCPSLVAIGRPRMKHD